jgi:hypothetical protein
MTKRRAVLVALLTVGFAVAPARGGVPAAQLRSYQEKSTLELTTTGRTSGELRTVTIWFVADDQAGCMRNRAGRQTDWYRNLIDAGGDDADRRAGDGGSPCRSRISPRSRVHELFRQKYLRVCMAEWIGSDTGAARSYSSAS